MTLWNVAGNIFDKGARKSDSNPRRIGGLIIEMERDRGIYRMWKKMTA